MPVDSDLRARDIMTTDVETVAPDDSVSEVLTRLSRAHFNGFPVVENDAVVGVVTQGDLVDIFQPSGRTLWIPIGLPPFLETTTYGIDLSWDDLDVNIDLAKNARKHIREVMTSDVVVVGPDASLQEVVNRLASEAPDINRLPVVEEGKLVGIIARQDVLQALASD
ncbi:MAG: CBS domain-containing protein [Halorientalis sp.]